MNIADNSSETYVVKLHGASVRVHLSHADCLRLLVEEGYGPPVVPAGCNTGTWQVQLASGEYALAVCQRRFRHTAADNEQELNGVSLMVLCDREWSEADAYAILERITHGILKEQGSGPARDRRTGGPLIRERTTGRCDGDPGVGALGALAQSAQTRASPGLGSARAAPAARS